MIILLFSDILCRDSSKTERSFIHMFLIDVSKYSVKSGMLSLICKNIKEALDSDILDDNRS